MSTSTDIAPLTTAQKVLAGAFVTSGVVHLVRPETFAALMPRWLPAHDAVIKGSGVAEIACAVGLMVPRTRRAAGVASAGLLAGVFPGNVEMARRVVSSKQAPTSYKAAALARLPLQWPLIRIALRAGK